VRYQKVFFRTAVFLILFLSACGQSTSPIITDDICAPPCWNGIIPGKTTEPELRSILDQLSIIDPESVVVSDQEPLFNHTYIVTLEKGRILVFINFLDNVVSLILFTPLDIIGDDLGITFGEAVEAFGEPEFVVNTTTMGPTKFLWFNVGINPWTLISAMHLQKGIEYHYRIPLLSKHPSQQIEPDTRLLEASFFDPAAFEQLADKRMFSGMNFEQTAERMYPWAGYGDIESKYPYIPFSYVMPE